MPLLFSYGSNTPEQLASRIGRRSIEGEPAYLPKYSRVFRGWSRNWQGGPASVIKDNNRTVYGWAANVTPTELNKLDRYEGVRSGNYARKRKNIMVWNGRDFVSKRAVLYVSTSNEYNRPAPEYVKAIVRMINNFWPKERGRWKTGDIPLRNNRRAIKMDYGVPDGGMTRRQLKSMEADARDLHGMLDDDDHLPPWLPPKIVRAQNDLSDARRIVRGELESRGIRTNPRYRRNPYGDDY